MANSSSPHWDWRMIEEEEDIFRSKARVDQSWSSNSCLCRVSKPKDLLRTTIDLLEAIDSLLILLSCNQSAMVEGYPEIREISMEPAVHYIAIYLLPRESLLSSAVVRRLRWQGMTSITIRTRAPCLRDLNALWMHSQIQCQVTWVKSSHLEPFAQ